MRFAARGRPADLIVVGILAGIVMPLALLGIGGAAGIVVAVLAVLILPGYSVVAALFPARDELGGAQRLALSVVMSLSLVPLAGLVAGALPGGFRLEAVVVALGCGTLAACAIAAIRRRRLPEDRRFAVALPFPRASGGGLSSTERALVIFLGAAIVAASGSIAYTSLGPPRGFTELYLLNETGVRGGYPTELSGGQEATVIVVIVSHEAGPVNYTVQVWLATLTEVFDTATGKNTTVETSRGMPASFPVPLQAGKEERIPYTFSIDSAGDYALTFHLYTDPSAAEPYRTARLVIRVA